MADKANSQYRRYMQLWWSGLTSLKQTNNDMLDSSLACTKEVNESWDIVQRSCEIWPHSGKVPRSGISKAVKEPYTVAAESDSRRTIGQVAGSPGGEGSPA